MEVCGVGSVTVYLPFELEKKVRGYIKKTGKTLSEVVQEALEEFLAGWPEGGDG